MKKVILGITFIILGIIDLIRKYISSWDYFTGFTGIICIIIGIYWLTRQEVE